MIAITLIITILTQMIASDARIMFLVAIKRMKKANIIAIVIPCKAEVTKAFSLAIHMKPKPPVYLADFNDLGAVSRYLLIYLTHLS